jgi:transcription elongation factor Elf1
MPIFPFSDMGGRKKSSKKVVKKKKPGLRTVFKCVQCNNEDSVECHMYVAHAVKGF